MIFVDESMTIDFFFFKQKTAYEMRISDWSSDVCSSDLILLAERRAWPCHLPRCCPEKVIRNRERSLHITIQSQCFIKATQRYCSQIVSIQRRRAHPPTQLGFEGRRASRGGEIGRASCRYRVCQSVFFSVVSVLFKKNYLLLNL